MQLSLFRHLLLFVRLIENIALWTQNVQQNHRWQPLSLYWISSIQCTTFITSVYAIQFSIILFLCLSLIGLILPSFVCLCLELDSSSSLLYVCVLNWSLTILFFMSVSWIGLILLPSLCKCFELVSYYSLLYACVLNCSHPGLFFKHVPLIGLILLFIRNRNACLCHSMLLLTLLTFWH